MLRGRFRAWNAANVAALDKTSHWLTEDARNRLSDFKIARTGSVGVRLRALHRSGARRQRLRGTAALWLAALLNRL